MISIGLLTAVLFTIAFVIQCAALFRMMKYDDSMALVTVNLFLSLLWGVFAIISWLQVLYV